MSKIPEVDLGPYLNRVPGSDLILAKQIYQLQTQVGYFKIVNHNVSEALIKKCYLQMRYFFNLPLAVKYRLYNFSSKLGYIPIRSTIYKSTSINENTERDLNETFLMQLSRPNNMHLRSLNATTKDPNPWPVFPTQFKKTIVQYQNEMFKLGMALLPLYALALSKEKTFFDKHFTDPLVLSRHSHYPPINPLPNQFGIAPHTDHGFITLLPIPDICGLQVKHPNGQWLEVDGQRNAIMVNTGDFLQRWTNGRFIATPHRVLSPTVDRYSLTFFFNPNPCTVADPRDFIEDDNQPINYKPLNFVDYLNWYAQKNYLPDAQESLKSPGRLTTIKSWFRYFLQH